MISRCDRCCDRLICLVPINDLTVIRWYARYVGCYLSRLDRGSGVLTILQKVFTGEVAGKVDAGSGKKN